MLHTPQKNDHGNMDHQIKDQIKLPLVKNTGKESSTRPVNHQQERMQRQIKKKHNKEKKYSNDKKIKAEDQKPLLVDKEAFHKNGTKCEGKESKKKKKKQQVTSGNCFIQDITFSLQKFLHKICIQSDLSCSKQQDIDSSFNIDDYNLVNVIHPVFEEEEKVPLFLRQFKLLNSVYPNFYHPQFSDVTQNENIKVLIYQCDTALKVLEAIFKQINKTKENIRYFSLQHKNVFTLKYFMESGWERYNEINEIKKIQPRQNFSRRKINQQKIEKGLKNYRDIVNFYQKNNEFGLPKEEQEKKYWKLRKIMWEIQTNMKLISEDLYVQGIKHIFPKYYHEYLYFLRVPLCKRNLGEKGIEHRLKVRKIIDMLQKEGDPVTCSQIGKAVKKRLRTELRNFS